MASRVTKPSARRPQGGGRSSRTGSSSSSSSPRFTAVKCRHYSRNVSLLAPCCNKVVCCHQGHDAARNFSRRLDLRAVSTVVCGSCHAAQPVANSCRACGISFGARGCTICRMWYSGEGFHCRGCGVCRKGRRADWYHCATCRMCFPLRSAASHRCAAAPGSEAGCAICGGDMLRARAPSTTMRCGHMVHCACFLKRVQRNYSCPVPGCGKTVADLRHWVQALDNVAAAEAGRHPTAPKRVYCFDCRRVTEPRSIAKKCAVPACGSHNTVRIPASQQHLPFAIPPTIGRL